MDEQRKYFNRPMDLKLAYLFIKFADDSIKKLNTLRWCHSLSNIVSGQLITSDKK